MDFRRWRDGPLRACLDEICADEVHHLAFHGDAFRGRPWFRRAWYPVTGAATLVVIVDHRAALRALRIPKREAAAQILGVLAGVARDLRRAPDACRDVPAGAEDVAAGARNAG